MYHINFLILVQVPYDVSFIGISCQESLNIFNYTRQWLSDTINVSHNMLDLMSSSSRRFFNNDWFKNHGKIWFCKVKKISLSPKGRGKPRRTEGGRKMQLERDEVSQATVRGIWKSEPRKLTKSSDPCYRSDTSSITLWSLGIPAYSWQLREAPLSFFHNSSLRTPFYISETTYAQTQIYDSKNYRFNGFSMAFLSSLLKSFRSSVGQ